MPRCPRRAQDFSTRDCTGCGSREVPGDIHDEVGRCYPDTVSEITQRLRHEFARFFKQSARCHFNTVKFLQHMKAYLRILCINPSFVEAPLACVYMGLLVIEVEFDVSLVGRCPFLGTHFTWQEDVVSAVI